MEEIDIDSRKVTDKIAALEAELGTALEVSLTSRDAKKLSELTEQVTAFEKDLGKLHAQTVEVREFSSVN